MTSSLPIVAMLDVFTNPDIEQAVLKDVAVVECYHAANSNEIPDRVSQAKEFRSLDEDEVRLCGHLIDGLTFPQKRKGLVPDYGTEEVADATMGLLLAAARKTCYLAQKVKEGTWPTLEAAGSKRLRDKQIGIVGLGRIGKAVAERAKAFGLKVTFYDPHLEDGIDKALGISRCDDLASLMRTSDFISLNCLLNSETKHIISAAALTHVKHGAFLINTGRGGLIDTAAMIAALRDGRLAGAALDVLEDEPTKPEDGIRAELREMPNVIITPHTAFYSDESIVELRTKTALEVRRALVGERLRNCVNMHLLHSAASAQHGKTH